MTALRITTDTAVGPTMSQRWRTARWVVLALVVDHRGRRV